MHVSIGNSRVSMCYWLLAAVGNSPVYQRTSERFIVKPTPVLITIPAVSKSSPSIKERAGTDTGPL